MKSFPLILRIYCLAAIVLLAWYGWSISSQVGQMRSELKVLTGDIVELTASENSASERYFALEAKQRRERGSYSGEEAVLASTAVMDAKEIYEQLNTELQASMARQAELETQAASLQLRIVPVIAIALLHLFGFFMIRIEKQDP